MPVLKYLSAIRFSDADAGDFLQNQLSADVLALATGESTFACYCEPKGRVLALMLVYRLEEAFLALLSSELAQPIADRMRIYVMRSKVSIEILNKCAVSGSQAQTSTAEDSALAKIPIPGSENHFVLLEQELAGDSDASAQRAWKAAEFQSGVTWLNSNSSGEFIPQMLGFDQIGAVNFRKGCYPGQEIVARTHYKGATKRRTLRFSSESPVTAGDKVSNGSRDIGDVLNVAGNELLAVVPVDKADTPLSVNGVGLTHLELPYL